MRVLWNYLQPHRGLVILLLILAGISQVLALVDPIIFGKIIDQYATPPFTMTSEERVKGALWLMLLAVVVALLSRLAKAFQEYFTNLVVQKFGVQIFNDGLKQTLKLSYQEYADQNSGETLSILQRVRRDTERFIHAFINILFSSVVGVGFLVWYAVTKHWALVPIFVIGILVLGGLTSLLSAKIKTMQRSINRASNKMSGVITESLRNIELVKSLGLTYLRVREYLVRRNFPAGGMVCSHTCKLMKAKPNPMKLYPLAIASLLLLASCGSDSADGNYNRAADDELIEAQIDTDTKTSIDSVARATDEGAILHPLPDTLTRLLQQRQPQVQVATLTDQAMSNRRLQVDNPVYLRGNLNGNRNPDYAVQVLQNDSIHILAFLDYGTPQVREIKVAAYPSQQLNDRRYSNLQLKLAQQDSLVRNLRQQQLTNLKTDGVSVFDGNRTTLYLLQNNRFIPFDAQQ